MKILKILLKKGDKALACLDGGVFAIFYGLFEWRGEGGGVE